MTKDEATDIYVRVSGARRALQAALLAVPRQPDVQDAETERVVEDLDEALKAVVSVDALLQTIIGLDL
jgi:hypothetical protein